MRLLSCLLCAAAVASVARAQEMKYPPLSEYLMSQDEEVALAKTAAPESISGRASVKVLTNTGYRTVHDGANGFVCLVMRGWTAPTYAPAPFRAFVYDSKIRSPICFDPIAAKMVMPYYELRTKLGLEGKSPEEMATIVADAYSTGKLPRREGVSFAYMWSAEQNLGPGIGHWHPHVMVFAPYYDNALVGDNAFGTPLPQATDDPDTPFAVIVIPVDAKLAVKRGGAASGAPLDHHQARP